MFRHCLTIKQASVYTEPSIGTKTARQGVPHAVAVHRRAPQWAAAVADKLGEDAPHGWLSCDVLCEARRRLQPYKLGDRGKRTRDPPQLLRGLMCNAWIRPIIRSVRDI
jgi:hypothetical protein